MSISKLFWWVYQLNPWELLLLFFLCTLAFLGLHRKLENDSRWRVGLAVLLIVWTLAALWATILNRSAGTVGEFQWIPFHSYREMLATENREILRSNFMNVVLFYPAGLLLAAILQKRWRAPVTMVIMAVFSLSIEAMQHILLLGRGEIDDVLHNTLGAWLGCLAFSMEHKLFAKPKKEQQIGKRYGY